MRARSFRLELSWYEPQPGEEKGHAWGQFLGGLHRLREITDELDDAVAHRNIEKALRRVQVHAEGCMGRAYEVRDRAMRLTQLLFPNEKNLGAMKNPADRPARLGRLAASHAGYAKTLGAFLVALDQDMLVRNRHTHEVYVSFRVVTSTDVFDPLDAWAT